ncbi:hypothetical protein BDV26DRAFT_223795 [Aspergillus bertholletiae]|uniref:Uncharacterized protein n=1 Tax=Aspergillus bertholletiae TaxID=1226010 RepID=A0A5N7BLT9_9EURO|nr:hypothetical protein BDV26DRAFT_223795 [Aspergillus bertholletiae]
MFKRLSWASTSPPTTSSRTETRRQDAAGNYLRRERLQALLERLFPDHPELDFHIRLDDEIWSFDAPREVTRQELREASD